MGLIWDLIQQGQLSDHDRRAGTLEQRVNELEMELQQTNRTLIELMTLLEQKFGQDLDGNGKIG